MHAGMENAGGIIFLIYTLICTVSDLKKRSISLPLSLLFAGFGAGISLLLGREPLEILTALIPGALIFAAAYATGGCIGTGDAVFILVGAMFLSVMELTAIVAEAWILCAIFALFLIAMGNFGPNSQKRGKAGLPYVAFTFFPIVEVLIKRL
ncbi:MAG: hypothetical protein Q4E57_05455 [Eubacteriales bacterium]|nr:hypothetical protein [Eubacteriales bacterium]